MRELVNVGKYTRKQELSLIWKNTHRDYRSNTNGEKRILMLRDGVTCSVLLSNLTDEEIKNKLRVKVGA